MRTSSPVCTFCATNVESVVSSRSTDCAGLAGNGGVLLPGLPPPQAAKSAETAAAAITLVILNTNTSTPHDEGSRIGDRYLCRRRRATSLRPKWVPGRFGPGSMAPVTSRGLGVAAALFYIFLWASAFVPSKIGVLGS